MPGRLTQIVTGEYYHLFNRGVQDLVTYKNDSDYKRAVFTLEYYNYLHPPVKLSRFFSIPHIDQTKILQDLRKTTHTQIEIIAYVFMPNHFHILVKQLSNNGVSKYMNQFQNSYTRYFNTKYERKGHVFQGPYKAVHISSESQLIHVSRYIHLNPVVSKVISKRNLYNYPWSSLPEYELTSPKHISPNIVLSYFKSQDSYKNFLEDHLYYATQLEQIKHLAID